MSKHDNDTKETKVKNSTREVSNALPKARTDSVIPGPHLPFQEALQTSMEKYDVVLKRLAK